MKKHRQKARSNPSMERVASGLDRFDSFTSRADSIYSRGRSYGQRGKDATGITAGQVIVGVGAVALAVGIGWYMTRGETT